MNVHPCMLRLLQRTIEQIKLFLYKIINWNGIFFYYYYSLFINALFLIVLQSETVVRFVVRNAAPKTGLGP